MKAYLPNDETLLIELQEGAFEIKHKISVSNGLLVLDDTWIDYTLLVTALQRDHRSIVDLLLKLGCRTNGFPKTNCNTPLYYAIQLDDVNIVKTLLERGASVYDKKDGKETLLCLAMRNKQWQIVDLILSMYDFDNVIPTSSDEIAHFLVACERDKLGAVRHFIKHGVSVNSFAISNGYTPLHFAVKNVSLKTVEFLLKEGADFNAKDSSGQTALQLAHLTREKIRSKQYQNSQEIEAIIDEILLSCGAHLHLTRPIDTDARQIPHFHIACTRDNPSLVGSYLAFNVDVNQRIAHDTPDAFGDFTPLHFAVYNNCTAVTALLLAHGADVNARTKRGLTPLYFAVDYDHVRLAEVLLKHGADVCTKCADGLTPLHYAFLYSSPSWNDAIVDLLLLHCPKDRNPVDNTGLSHFHIACTRGDTEVVRGFLESNVSLNARVGTDNGEVSGYSALHFAVKFNQKTAIRLLLQHGATVNIGDDKRMTPLHLACVQNYAKLYDIVRKNKYNTVDLTRYFEGQVEIVELLLSCNGDPNARDSVDTTPLYYAYGSESLKKGLMEYLERIAATTLRRLNSAQGAIVKLLVANGADVNARMFRGRTVLHNAALLSHSVVVHETNALKHLLKADCNVNAVDDEGKTPLFLASSSKDVFTATELLSYGADVNVTDNLGLTVLCHMHQDNTYNYNMFTLIQSHLKKLIALGSHVGDRVKLSYTQVRNRYEKNEFDFLDSDNDSDFEDEDEDDFDLDYIDDQFSVKCRAELERMKHVKLDTYSTLYDILHKDANEMTKYIKSNDFKVILQSDDCKRNFAVYFDFLKLQYRRGAARSALLHAAKDSLGFLIGLGLPDACSERIFRYLDNDNIRSLIGSVHYAEAVKRRIDAGSIDDFEPSVKHLRLEQ